MCVAGNGVQRRGNALELGWPLPKRRQYLKELVAQQTSKTHPVPFQGKMQYLPVHTVPLGLPLYRLENGRTTGRQAEYLASHQDLPSDFFRSDSESGAAQKAQHQILTLLTKERKNLFKEFESHPQTEPIILSSLGYVVNGNRRLSTWRELFSNNQAKFERFRNVEVVILPVADDKEIDRVEAELQLKEDLKADYSWTSTALMMREKMERYGYEEEELASVYGMDKKVLTELFDSLDYAQQYLEARDLPNKFSEVDGKEYAFIQICRTRKKMKASEEAKELFERAAFCLTDEAGEGKRIYSEIPKIADHLAKIVESLADELEIDTTDTDPNKLALKVSDAIAKKENQEKARLVIRDTIEAESSLKRDKKKQNYVASMVARARTALNDAKDGIDKRSNKGGISLDLDAIDKLSSDIRAWLKDSNVG